MRVTVQADGATVIREGHGTGEGRGTSPGEVHDIALKAAETDATKRALATFGKPFGLELYRGGRKAAPATVQMPLPAPAPSPPSPFPPMPVSASTRTTRPLSHGHPATMAVARIWSPGIGRRVAVNCRGGQQSAPRSLCRPHPVSCLGKSTRALLTIAEPKRLRDKAHLKFVASQPCLVCGRQPSDPHHLRFAQPRALGLKVSDEFTVPLCRGHHRQLHQAGNEVAWWERLKIKPLETAKTLWEQTHPASADVPLQPTNIPHPSNAEGVDARPDETNATVPDKI